jgi:hypothetical protein
MVAAEKTVVNMKRLKVKESGMNRKTEKRRLKSAVKFSERLNSAANLTLRKEIFRLARNRDILGISLIISALAIITLSILLYRHW